MSQPQSTLVVRLWSHLRSLRSRVYVRLARASGSELATEIFLGRGCEVDLGMDDARRGNVRIGKETTLVRDVIIHPYGGHVHIGARAHLGPGTVIYGQGGVEIGDDCLIGMHCRILSSNHDIPPVNRRIRWEKDVLKPTRIGNDVWLGAGVTVLGGITLGDGCVIGAGAVVTNDIPPGAIAYGTPARVVGQRPLS